jgi:Protein of unknown function (DUF1761)
MNITSMNWLAVLACFVFSIISGSIWFGPKTFFPTWWTAIGKSQKDQPNGAPLTWVLMMISSAVQAIFMAMIVNGLTSAGSKSIFSGALIGFLVWLGIVAPSALVNKLFPGRILAWAIETGNHLINYVVFGAILGAW